MSQSTSPTSSTSSHSESFPLVPMEDTQHHRNPQTTVTHVAQSSLPPQGIHPLVPPLSLGATHTVTPQAPPQIPPFTRLITALVANQASNNAPHLIAHNTTMYAVWSTPPSAEGVRIQIQPYAAWQAGNSFPNKEKLSLLIDPVSGILKDTSYERAQTPLSDTQKHLVNALLMSAELPPLFTDLPPLEVLPPQEPPLELTAASSAPSLTTALP